MLNREAIENIQLIKDTAHLIWGDKCRFGEVEVIDSPYSEFNLPMRLYDLYDIKLVYDRSTLSIGVPAKEGYKVLSRVADENVFCGFDGLIPENLLHNFKVLDRVLKKGLKGF